MLNLTFMLKISHFGTKSHVFRCDSCRDNAPLLLLQQNQYRLVRTSAGRKCRYLTSRSYVQNLNYCVKTVAFGQTGPSNKQSFEGHTMVGLLLLHTFTMRSARSSVLMEEIDENRRCYVQNTVI